MEVGSNYHLWTACTNTHAHVWVHKSISLKRLLSWLPAESTSRAVGDHSSNVNIFFVVGVFRCEKFGDKIQCSVHDRPRSEAKILSNYDYDSVMTAIIISS